MKDVIISVKSTWKAGPQLPIKAKNDDDVSYFKVFQILQQPLSNTSEQKMMSVHIF